MKARSDEEKRKRAESVARRRDEKAAFAAWESPIGTAVDVTRDDGSVLRTTTRSTPWKLDDGTPVILVAGISGGYLLTRVRPVAPEAPRS